MAILNKIREKTLVLILVIALALFAFIISGIFTANGSFSGKSQDVVATINGQDVNRADFMRQVENTQRRFGGQMSSTQAMNQVWEQEVRKAVMNGQYDKLGISVQRDQMRDLIKQNMSTFEEFKNEVGQFDEGKLNEFIANLKAISPEAAILGQSQITYDSWTTFEGQIADGGLYQNYFNMVKAGVTTTLAEAELEYKLENEKVDIKYVQVPYASIPDSTISITESDVKAYVKAHKSQYEVDASRDIRYVEFKEEPTASDNQETRDRIVELLNNERFSGTNDVVDFINENSDIKFNDAFLFKDKMPLVVADSIFARPLGGTYGPYKQDNLHVVSKIVAETQLPDSVKVRHILIPFKGATRADVAIVKTDEEAKKTADSILRVVKNSRSKFNDLLVLSSDKVSNEKGGEIEFTYQQSQGYAPEFRDFSFNNKKGDLDVVKTDFGYHVIEVLDQKNKQRVIKVANLALEVEPSEDTVDAVFNATSKFEIGVEKGNFDDVAKESNYTVKPVNGLTELTENVVGLGAQRGIVRWAFEDGVDVGDIKKFNLSSGGYVVVMLSGINKEGLMTNDKAKISATAEIRKEKKAKLLMDRISASTLADLASSESQTVKTALGLSMKNPTVSGAGREPIVVGAAFGLKEGQTSKLIKGDNGIYMIEVTKITAAPELPSYQANVTRLNTAKATNANTALYNALKDASDIEDNRGVFY